MVDEYLDLALLSKRLSLSPRTLRTWVSDSVRPLPAYRVGGKLLFRWPEVVKWLQGFRIQPIDAAALADQILKEVGGAAAD